MLLAISNLRKAFATIFTFVRFHSRVNSFVYPTNVWPAKAFIAGFSPVWIRSCLWHFQDEMKRLSQYWHLWGFPFAWIRLWLLHCDDWMKLSLQSLHLKLFFPLLPFVAFVSMSDCVGCITVWAWCCIMFPWVPLYDIEIKIVNLGRRANIFEISLYHICFFIRC